jgi:two-component system KDP operon response regulator KdpE
MLDKNPVILAIEDELSIRRFLKTSLSVQGYQFLETRTGKEGLALALENKPDVILLDLGLPDMDGIEVIKNLRAWTSIPVIILSARDQENDKVAALDFGADDYLTKPFSICELNARLRVALRHAERINEKETPLFQADNLQIDLVDRQVMIGKSRITLSPIQYAILATLARRANKIVTHKQLLRAVWGEKHTEDVEYLRIYIHQLRHKIEQHPAYPKYLITEPGVGYRLVCKMS